ncbi:MAG: TetR/AcrR family transcriptional regulator [Faecousia sp.]
MNEKFFSLPRQKQQTILNAGFRVFSRNSYRKSPMQEIADAAGISKSLLFHYFHNKKELYLFLWDTCARITYEAVSNRACLNLEDPFDILCAGLEAKISVMRQYPDLGVFALRCFCEKDPEVCQEIQRRVASAAAFSENAPRLRLDPARFRPGTDLEMMYWTLCWASEGYLWERQENLNVGEMEQDFRRLIAFLKSVCLKEAPT